MKDKSKEIIENRFKNFSPGKKLKLAEQLYFEARELKKAALKEFHPDWNEMKIKDELRKIFLHARS